MRGRLQSTYFYGWNIVAAVFMLTLVGFGCAYTFSSFMASLQTEFGASRGAISLVFSLAGFLYFGLGVVTGPLADRWGARKLIALGICLIGAGFILASRAQSILHVYLAYSLGVGLGVGCAYVPALGVVQRWFVRRRGLASGLAVSGIGVGTLVMPPLALWLISAFSWRTAYLVIGVVAVLMGLCAAMMVIDKPARLGLAPDGEKAAAAPASPDGHGLTVRQAVRTLRFLGLYAACLFSAIGVFVPFVHLIPYALEHQISGTNAVVLLGMIGVGSTAGRSFLGGVADRIGRGVFLVVTCAGMSVSLGIWNWGEGFFSLSVFALLFGVFYGGWVAVLPAVVADYFGERHVAGIIGALYTSVAIGTLLGPAAAGFLFDFSGSYSMPILISAGTNALAAIIAWATARSRAPMGWRQDA